MPLGCLPLLLFFWFLMFLPLFWADVMISAMAKLGLSPSAAVQAVFWIFLGGLINIPIGRIPRRQPIRYKPFDFLGMDRWVHSEREQDCTIIAVNVGGCLIPCLLVLYELNLLWLFDPSALVAVLIATVINVAVCYQVAQPIAYVGIAMPPFVPAVTAVLCALVLAPSVAAPVAFIAGVLGPLIGADLLHLHEVETIETGVASIGGAGTFDGIVISGLLAVLLA